MLFFQFGQACRRGKGSNQGKHKSEVVIVGTGRGGGGGFKVVEQFLMSTKHGPNQKTDFRPV